MKIDELIDSIRKIAILNIKEEKEIDTYEKLVKMLRRWWCINYNRPYKDPILDSYNFEELLLEYYECYYQQNPEKMDVDANKESILGTDEEYEAWLKEQMGDAYMTKEEMIGAKNKEPENGEQKDTGS